MNFIIIIFLTSIAGLMVGYYFSKRLKQNEIFYDECVKICNYLLIEMKFRQEKITVALKDFANKCESDLKNIIENYVETLEGGKEFILKDNVDKDFSVLLKEFLKNLGSTDTFTQIDILENYKERFSYYFERARQKNTKYNKMSLQLGLMCGLAVGILII